MSYCECDYDPPSVYRVQKIKAARKPHKCSECSRTIKPGEAYEHTWGVWDGNPDSFCTCSHCLDLREFITAHVPCTCWAHGNIRDDAMQSAQAWAHETTGLLFGAWRREVKIRRAVAAQRATP
jgi:hypothetical protein